MSFSLDHRVQERALRRRLSAMRCPFRTSPRGDIFRKHLKEGTDLGELAKSFMNKGQLVPDSVVCDIVASRLIEADCAGGALLDGFPRTVVQAEMLSAWLETQGRVVGAVINLEVEDAVLVSRLSGRRTWLSCGATYHVANNPPTEAGTCDRCGGEVVQRKDDSEETVCPAGDLRPRHGTRVGMVDLAGQGSHRGWGSTHRSGPRRAILTRFATEMIQLKADWELAAMRSSGRRLAEVGSAAERERMCRHSTADLDRMAEEMIRDMGAVPAFKGYAVEGTPPFPATICASPNAQVVHGIPTAAPLDEGDLIRSTWASTSVATLRTMHFQLSWVRQTQR